jgi:transcriptional regulator with GAF, ATPase, and Fis domain
LNRKDEAGDEAETSAPTQAESAPQENSIEKPTAPSSSHSTVKMPDEDPEVPATEKTNDAFAGELEDILKPFEDDKQIQKNGPSSDTVKPDIIKDDRTAVNCVDVFEAVYFQTNEKDMLKKIVGIINQTIAVNFAVILSCSSSKPDCVQVDEVLLDTGSLFAKEKITQFKNATLAKIMQNNLPAVASMDNLGGVGIEEDILIKAKITSCLLVPLCHNDMTASFLGLAFNATGLSNARLDSLIWIISTVALAYDRVRLRKESERLKATFKQSVQSIERELGHMS